MNAYQIANAKHQNTKIRYRMSFNPNSKHLIVLKPLQDKIDWLIELKMNPVLEIENSVAYSCGIVGAEQHPLLSSNFWA